MQKIIPNLWFDKEAKEAAELYTTLFEDSKILSSRTLKDTPSGDTEIISFNLSGQKFMAISAGPLFQLNPSISFHVKCQSKDEVNKIWEALSKDGKVLMELGEYAFSELYGWLQDKYGLSWQIILTGEMKFSQKITPVIMYTGEVCGKAEEAIKFYTSVFKNSQIQNLIHYGKGEDPEKEGFLKYGAFKLFDQEFGAMDSARQHDFSFNEAISFIINCQDQEEVDYFWDKLSYVPEAEQCGWLKDKYGLSWQVVPRQMEEMMGKANEEQMKRVMEAFLKMKKFDLQKLQEAYEG